MQRQSFSLCVDTNSTQNTPYCEHGPTLLFERYSQKDGVQRFYACSAYRNKKLCNFYQKSKGCFKEKQHMPLINKFTSRVHFLNLQKRLNDVKQLKPSQRCLCHSCGILLLPPEIPQHQHHKCQINLTNEMLDKPSSLLTPLDNTQSNAQFFFKDKTTDVLLNLVERLGHSKVLCIGTPKMHEGVLAHGLSSLLLDLDHRLGQFFSPGDFLLYNMFNNYLFGGSTSKQVLEKFLTEDTGSVIVVMDPPFGGFVQLIVQTLRALSAIWRNVNKLKRTDALLPTFWCFPYFMEDRITAELPFVMLNYKVEYENHKTFRQDCSRSKATSGSIVRLFTNKEHSSVPLPVEDGYWFCKACKMYMSKEMSHCKLCGICPNKDGRQWRHCHKCNRCAKYSWKHCNKCRICLHPQHRCGQAIECQACGQNHKWIDCPKLQKRPCEGYVTDVPAVRTDKPVHVNSHTVTMPKCSKKTCQRLGTKLKYYLKAFKSEYFTNYYKVDHLRRKLKWLVQKVD